ncbi:hypothetical protein [uncultured Clostridium sp.]|uniref:hypothetical protein n=1 Tax=uncultured Clostridium sp. TaxID=59620 RepID=UPI00261CC0C2|nr:hypothetical protein [uncultured Clostridium sp.]
MNTKLQNLIRRCQQNTEEGNCEQCECNERQCLGALMDAFTERRLEKEESDIKNRKPIRCPEYIASRIIEERSPLGLFWTKEGQWYIGIDNSRGEAFCEEFKTKEECFRWLNGI